MQALLAELSEAAVRPVGRRHEPASDQAVSPLTQFAALHDPFDGYNAMLCLQSVLIATPNLSANAQYRR